MRGVLDGTATLDADAADAVLADREEPAAVSSALLLLQSALVASLGPIGVEALHNPATGGGQVGGVGVAGHLQQQVLGSLAQAGIYGQPVHRRDHDLGLDP